MAKPRSTRLDIYGAWLHHAPTPKAWHKLRDNTIGSLPDIDDSTLGLTSRDITDDGAVHLSVYLDTKTLAGNPVGTAEIAAHEATHAAGMLLDHIGQPYDGESEALAYLVGFITAWLWQATTEA